MKKILWYLGTDGSNKVEGEFEVEDGASADEIEQEAKEHAFNHIDWGWREDRHGDES